MEHWYALYTKPRKEHQVNAYLQGQGVVTYLPSLPRKTRRRDRTERVAYFPCYMFARLDFDTTARSAVAWMPGVRRIVGGGEQPAPVPDEMVDLIRERLAEKEKASEQKTSYGDFRQGDRVRIVSGPLHDLDAVFDRAASAAERVRVLLEVMGRMTSVEVDVADIKKTYTPKTPAPKRGTRRIP